MLVVFIDVATRDMVMSYAANLAAYMHQDNPPGVRLDYPDRREYARNRRIDRWRMFDKLCQSATERAKAAFFENVKTEVKSSGNTAGFFRAVKKLAQGDQKIDDWSINEMYPGECDLNIAEKMATFFNKISSEYDPLQAAPGPQDIPSSICSELHQVAACLKSFKKPRSMVNGDIFRQLITKYQMF